ncbi:MBL fold metallo-hydrolase [uncultured Parvibaculum sp.]|uniref:MBL fold metallo-hydrolase n=1 Tax=uncultured Parvibaculum sp. TaxID=291828 RepID=UPI0030DD4718
MSTWVKVTLGVVAVLLAIGSGVYWWLIVDGAAPDKVADFALDIDDLRRLANERPGDKPGEIRVEEVAAFAFPATAVVAGDGWKTVSLPVFTYQIAYPDGHTVIVDTALEKEMGGDNLASFDPEAYARMEQAMGDASLILITHEHMDHIGGLTAYPDLPAVLPQTKLTAEQVAHPERSVPAKFPDGALDGYEGLDYAHYDAIAPGIVLIKSPGHTPGSQMVYVQTADGKEVLLIGDVAWHYKNIEVMRERARLVTKFMLKENRGLVFSELKALADLADAAPEVAIVPGHDGGVVTALLDKGVMARGFAE